MPGQTTFSVSTRPLPLKRQEAYCSPLGSRVTLQSLLVIEPMRTGNPKVPGSTFSLTRLVPARSFLLLKATEINRASHNPLHTSTRAVLKTCFFFQSPFGNIRGCFGSM